MHDDSEVLQKKLLKLLQDLIPDVSLADMEAVSRQITGDLGHVSPTSVHSFSPQDASSLTSNQHGYDVPEQRETLLELGEIPAVQDRFYSLLKQRLQTEIQKNPPLFPWESELQEYETDILSSGVLSTTEAPADRVATGRGQVPAWLWVNQLKSLNLPMALPETVLTQLLQRCQEVAQSGLREGAKLVSAVEELFPDQNQALNYLAGLVITSPARSPQAVENPSSSVSYEAAAPAQQMLLSLLAAREILSSLSLVLSTNQPKVEREWVTEAGVLSLVAEYESDLDFSRLRIQSHLPCGGSLLLYGSEGPQSKAERPVGGNLSVELFDLEPHQIYSLEVRLNEKDSDPLVFMIQLD
jgi:hypothetical protein